MPLAFEWHDLWHAFLTNIYRLIFNTTDRFSLKRKGSTNLPLIMPQGKNGLSKEFPPGVFWFSEEGWLASESAAAFQNLVRLFSPLPQ